MLTVKGYGTIQNTELTIGLDEDNDPCIWANGIPILYFSQRDGKLRRLTIPTERRDTLHGLAVEGGAVSFVA